MACCSMLSPVRWTAVSGAPPHSGARLPASVIIRGRCSRSSSTLPGARRSLPRQGILPAVRAITGAEAPQLMFTVAHPPISTPPLNPAGGCPMWQNPILLCLAAGVLLAVMLLRTRDQKAAVVEQPDADALDLQTVTTDPLAFERALARTRQATYIAKAVTLLRVSEPAKAYMELSNALHENSICRRPFISGTVRREDLVALYQLAIRCGEVPPQFSTLLQLQAMLGFGLEEAERLERDVMASSGGFSI